MGIIHILKGGSKMNLLKRLFVEEEGQGLVEYALIIALIVGIVVIAMTTLEGGITGMLTKVKTSLENAIK